MSGDRLRNKTSTHHIGLAALLSYLVLASFAIGYDFLYFGDGAYIAFTFATGHPWELFWHYFPLRLGSSILVGAPVWLFAQLGASPVLIGKAYQVIFLSMPLLSSVLLRQLVPSKEYELWVTWLIFLFATLGMSTFGYPTETWIMLALLLPVFAMIIYPQSGFRAQFKYLLIPLFCFSYEAVALCAPAILVALYKQFDSGDRKNRLRILTIAIAFAACGAIWSLLYFDFVPNNPLLVRALRENQKHLWTLRFLKIPISFYSTIVVSIVLYHALWSTKRPEIIESKWFRIILAILPLLVLLQILIVPTPNHRYFSRTPIVWLAPLIAFAFAQRPTCLSKNVIYYIVLPAIIVQTVYAGYSIHGWSVYRSAMQSYTQNRTILACSKWRSYVWKFLPRSSHYYWGWATPYTMIMLNGRHNLNDIILDDVGWYVPTTCDNARKYYPKAKFVSTKSIELLIQDICTKNTTD